jgi:TolB-like protein/tetratricopeptide (TPR) repeat protein
VLVPKGRSDEEVGGGWDDKHDEKLQNLSNSRRAAVTAGGTRSYRFGEFSLEVANRQLLQKGRSIVVRPKVFETLLFLVERHGHLVAKDDLLSGVWAETNVSDAVLTHCITEVRQALRDDPRNPRFLKTVPKAGYRFIADVEADEAAAPRPPTAIAVLPFVNISGDPENEYFCDGLSEELINGLTKIAALRVVAHSSSFAFKGRDTDVREIGRQLNVGSIVEGSVRKAGDRLRISAQLINATDGYHKWGEQYDRRIEDVFAIQGEIAAAILGHLKVELLESRSMGRRPAASIEAYRLFLKGRGFWHRRFGGMLQKAMECFEQAIARDPKFAPAYTGLADCFTTLGVWAFAPAQSVFPKARDLASRALDLDDQLAEAHATLAFVDTMYDWGWEAADRQFALAITLNPGHALTRMWNGHYLSIVGRMDEAIAEMRVAQDLDPLSPVVSANLGWTFLLAHDQNRAIEELRRVLSIDHGSGIAHFYLGYAYAAVGRLREAIGSFRKTVEATGGMPWLTESIAWIQGLSGNREVARRALGDAEGRMQQGYVPSSALAMIHLGLGHDDAVLEWLERGLAERDALMVWIKFMPCFDHLHRHPRFQALLRGIGVV